MLYFVFLSLSYVCVLFVGLLAHVVWIINYDDDADADVDDNDDDDTYRIIFRRPIATNARYRAFLFYNHTNCMLSDDTINLINYQLTLLISYKLLSSY